jgi:UDP-GlcNAc:undecaprenyl-phosphate GlcNAc-1-phosphate transferase
MFTYFAASMAGAAVAFPPALNLARRFGFTDTPGYRKLHRTPIAVVGGIVVILTALVASISFEHAFTLQMGLIYGIILLSLLLGATDDFANLTATYRLKIQLMVAFTICLMGFRVDNFYGILGIYHIPTYVQYPVTIFILTGLVNAFNMMDGINGLIGGFSLINFIILGMAMFAMGNPSLGILAFSLGGSLVVFLYHNMVKKTVFLGDAGSMTFGLIQGLLALQLLKSGHVMLGQVPPISLVVALFALPVLDTIRVMGTRVLHGNSPFRADRSHIHHYALQILPVHAQSSVLIWTMHALILVAMYGLQIYFNAPLSILLLLVVTYTLIATVIYQLKIKKVLKFKVK